MTTVLSILKEAQENCRRYVEWFDEVLPDSENFFVMLLKHAMSAEEVLDCIGRLRVKTRKEGNERIMLVLRPAWIFSLSLVEYSIKRLIKESSGGALGKWYGGLSDDRYVSGKKRGFSLRTVIEKSRGLGLIDIQQYESWIGLQEMRNAIVHNNAYIEKDTVFTVGDVVKDIKAGEKVRYSHLDGAYFLKLIPAMSKDWLMDFLSHLE